MTNITLHISITTMFFVATILTIFIIITSKRIANFEADLLDIIIFTASIVSIVVLAFAIICRFLTN